MHVKTDSETRASTKDSELKGIENWECPSLKQASLIVMKWKILTFRSTFERWHKVEPNFRSFNIARHFPTPYFAIPDLREASSSEVHLCFGPPMLRPNLLYPIQHEHSCAPPNMNSVYQDIINAGKITKYKEGLVASITSLLVQFSSIPLSYK
jgi:hypothetical protein